MLGRCAVGVRCRRLPRNRHRATRILHHGDDERGQPRHERAVAHADADVGVVADVASVRQYRSVRRCAYRTSPTRVCSGWRTSAYRHRHLRRSDEHAYDLSDAGGVGRTTGDRRCDVCGSGSPRSRRPATPRVSLPSRDTQLNVRVGPDCRRTGCSHRACRWRCRDTPTPAHVRGRERQHVPVSVVCNRQRTRTAAR